MVRRFVVINTFKDLKDGGHLYNKGDFYPRNGKKVDGERVDALASDNNSQKKPLIVEVLNQDAADKVESTTEDGATKKTQKKETKKKQTKK